MMRRRIIIGMGLLVLSLGANAQTNNEADSTTEKISKMEKIENGVKSGYHFIENGAVKGYKSIEKAFVNGFTEVNDAIIRKVFGREGETIDDTKNRLNAYKKSNKEIR